LSKFVVWLPEMPRKKLSRFYLGACRVLGQFGTPVFTYSSAEPLAVGTPVSSFFQPLPNRVPFYQTPPPINSTMDIAVIADEMRRSYQDLDSSISLPYKSWEWARENCSETVFIQAFQNLFRKFIFGSKTSGN